MIHIGQYNRLKITGKNNEAYVLDGEGFGQLFLPVKEVQPHKEAGEEITVFLYHGHNGMVTPTCKTPLATAGTFAYLRVTSVDKVGAFLDWGLPKDLLVPFREQVNRLVKGRYYTVYVYLDTKSGRLVATTKIDKALDKTPALYKEGEKVDLLIWGKSDIGIKAIINNAHWGVLYQNEIFQKLKCGERIPGFIKTLRDDGKVDLSLYPPGHRKVDALSETLVSVLKEHDGFLPLTDRSSPREIYAMLGASKKTFKKAVGALYKRQMIIIKKDGIKLV